MNVIIFECNFTPSIYKGEKVDLSSDLETLKTSSKTIGARQTAQAIQKGKAKVVFVAKDSDEWVVRDIIDMCKRKSIKIVFVDSKKELGRLCGINVCASSAAIIE